MENFEEAFIEREKRVIREKIQFIAKLWIWIKLIKSRQVQKQINYSSFVLPCICKENNKANFLSKQLCYPSSLK